MATGKRHKEEIAVLAEKWRAEMKAKLAAAAEKHEQVMVGKRREAGATAAELATLRRRHKLSDEARSNAEAEISRWRKRAEENEAATRNIRLEMTEQASNHEKEMEAVEEAQASAFASPCVAIIDATSARL